MHIELKKSSGRPYCRHPECKRNPKYIDDNYKIRRGTICCKISLRGSGGYVSAFYCRECLEKIHNDIREKLNPKLWVFS